jgi:thiol:disulfide interchange protein DsbD
MQITGKADWLACADLCLPATGPLSLTLPVSAAPSAATTTYAGAIAATRAQLPTPSEGWQVRGFTIDSGYIVAVIPASGVAATLTTPYFFSDSADVLEHALPQHVARAGDTLFIALSRAKFAKAPASALHGVLAADVTAATQRSWQLTTSVTADIPAAVRARAVTLLASATAQSVGGASESTPSVEPATAIPDPTTDMSVVVAIGFAFIGGLLLNLMPCVFPVLSVKVLALLEYGGGNAARGRRHGLAFGAGVLLSFWLLAGVLMALRAGGEKLGWGFQLQSPIVVALLALLMFALALNLSGVFEIGLTLTQLGAKGAGTGYGDSLLTGVLAVLVAAPCTAPFMGAALGFALVQPAFVGMLVFTALALGLALPFVILASAPQLLRFLPRPGAWLETLKQLFAFPLYATVVWLLWVFGQQAGVDALAVVLLALIVFALGAWSWARGVRADRSTTRLAAIGVMLGAVTITALGATRMTRPAIAAAVTPGWEPWSEQRVRQLRKDGRPIFVDFTAAWCLSCQVNERVALRTQTVERAFSAANVALLRADWTSRDSSITNVLASFGRSGVPLYVLYPAGTGAPAILPAVLTPGIVVDAVKDAVPTNVAQLPRIR